MLMGVYQNIVFRSISNIPLISSVDREFSRLYAVNAAKSQGAHSPSRFGTSKNNKRRRCCEEEFSQVRQEHSGAIVHALEVRPTRWRPYERILDDDDYAIELVVLYLCECHSCSHKGVSSTVISRRRRRVFAERALIQCDVDTRSM